jgi:ferritin
MKLSNKLEKVLNDQINLEFCSAYAYLGMAAYFDRTPFLGFAKWMKVQSGEELGHANRFFKYIVERGGKVTLQAIPEPKSDYKSPLDAFKVSLGHEQKVSAAICAIYELAAAEKDYPTLSFLKWFLDEQVEEERNVGDMLAKLELVGDNASGLYQVDRHAALRAAESAKS